MGDGQRRIIGTCLVTAAGVVAGSGVETGAGTVAAAGVTREVGTDSVGTSSVGRGSGGLVLVSGRVNLMVPACRRAPVVVARR